MTLVVFPGFRWRDAERDVEQEERSVARHASLYPPHMLSLFGRRPRRESFPVEMLAMQGVLLWGG